jgi:hypothetical protein
VHSGHERVETWRLLRQLYKEQFLFVTALHCVNHHLVLIQPHAKEKEIKVSLLEGMYLSSNDDTSARTLSPSPSTRTPKPGTHEESAF